jgi:hypothetical protein
MQTNLDSIFKNDDQMEKDGIWFKISDTTKFKIRRFGGANEFKMRQVASKYYKPYARAIEQGTLDVETTRLINVKTFVHACLVDWEGVVIDGKEAPFNEEAAIKFFMHLPVIFDILFEYAQDSKNYRADLGNS